MSRRQTTLHVHDQRVTRRWHEIDASGVPLGRLAVEVATVLIGKHRPEYTPHVDTGEHVVVTNATKVVLTGNKGAARMKQRYTEYPSGLKEESYESVRDRKPEKLIQDAVRRMMPKNRLSRVMLKKLRVVAGAQHEHGMHKPSALTVS
jgi:large subunit ribosomal protein L13